MTFRPGESGNPKGRPRGRRNKATLAVERLLEGEAERLTRKAIELAAAGDVTCIRICLDRICAPRRDRHVRFSIPKISTAEEAADLSALVLSEVARGALTPSEGVDVMRVIEGYAMALDKRDFAARLRAVEGSK